jgi:hypothetical protein
MFRHDSRRTGAIPPDEVNIVSPADLATYYQASVVTVTVSAVALQGVTSVRVYQGTNLIGAATSTPCSVLWTNSALGDYVLTALAMDTQGNVTTSMPVRVDFVSPLWVGSAHLGSGWRWLAWLGYFNTAFHPWIYHLEHGWMYCSGTSSSSIWFWTLDMSWVWSTDTVYPYLWRQQDASWLWYLKNSSAPRWFYNFSSSTWESW